MAIKLVNQNSNLTLASKMMKGDPGEPGPAGEPGERGPAGVYVGLEEPTDPEILVWMYTDGNYAEGFVTKEYVDERLSHVEEPDLSAYAKTEEVTAAISGKADKEHEHSQYLTEHQSLEAYALKSELPTVPTKLSAFENDKGYLTEHQSLEDYALKSELPSLEGYAKTEQIPDVSGFQTESQVNTLINNALSEIGVAEEGAY